MEKTKILIVGDPLSSVTGLAYVAGSFARYFIQQENYEVGYFTLRGRFEGPIRSVKDDVLDDLKIYTMPSYDVIKYYTQTIEDFKPHIVLTVADPWDLEVVAFNTYRYSYCWFAYTTIEIPELYSDRIYAKSQVTNLHYIEFFPILNKADMIIPVTQMAKNTLLNFEKGDKKLKNIYDGNIYNGLDVDLKIKEKKNKFDVFNGFIQNDDFLFMTLGVNSERKKIEQVIISFSKFLEKLKKQNIDTEKIKLYLHTNTHDAPSGTDLRAVIDKYNVNKNVLGMATNPAVEKEKIYELYSVCDVYISLSGGEGFNLGIAEAMLHEKPIIYIDYGGHVEFAKYGGLPVKIRDYIWAIRLGVTWALPDINDTVNKMKRLYKNPSLRKELGKKGFIWVMQNLDWGFICRQLESLILDYYTSNKHDNMYGMKFKSLI